MAIRLSAWRVATSGLVCIASIGACSSANKGGLPTGDDGTGAAGGGSDTSAGDASTGPNFSGGGSSGTSPGGSFSGSSSGGTMMSVPIAADAACASSVQKGEQRGLNAYMMLDYSGSMMMMGKWTGVTSAINSFVQQAPPGISVGMQYFGLPNNDPDAGVSILGIPLGDSCDPNVYAMPAIEIAPLPGVGSMITASLASHTTPNTATPTGPALQGAIQHATTWSMAHPNDVSIVILATDGDPSECGTGTATSTASLLSQVETIAAAGVAQTPKILTFVIGVGTDTSNLNGIAMAGGTDSAFIVDTSMNVSQQFLDALNKIRGAALGCQYKIPLPTSGSAVDFHEVNVQFTPPNGKPLVVPYVPDKSKCPASGDAWYYDNASMPTEILLCTTTCGTVSAGGEVDVLTGCQTVVQPAK
jgi:hypothetical protein